MATLRKLAVFVTLLLIRQGVRLYRARLPLPPRATWPSNPNGGAKHPAGSMRIGFAGTAPRLPVSSRRCHLNPPRHLESKPPIRLPKIRLLSLSHPLLPGSSVVTENSGPSASKFQFRCMRWDRLQIISADRDRRNQGPDRRRTLFCL